MTSKIETKPELAEREAAMAKALSMSVLFQKEYFKDIIGAINEKNVGAFSAVCKRANLDESDKNWLWHYLNHHHKGLARASDMKWKTTDADIVQW